MTKQALHTYQWEKDYFLENTDEILGVSVEEETEVTKIHDIQTLSTQTLSQRRYLMP